jgi:hypothetical protein
MLGHTESLPGGGPPQSDSGRQARRRFGMPSGVRDLVSPVGTIRSRARHRGSRPPHRVNDRSPRPAQPDTVVVTGSMNSSPLGLLSFTPVGRAHAGDSRWYRAVWRP